MAKPKILRNEAAHGVSVRDGSGVAESRSHDKRESPDPAPASAAAAPSGDPAPANSRPRMERRVTPPKEGDAVVRPKTKLRRAPPQVPIDESVPVPSPLMPAMPEARALPPLAAPEAQPLSPSPSPAPALAPEARPLPPPAYRPLRAAPAVAAPDPSAVAAEAAWEPGHVIVQRLSSLKNRNAKLYDMIQRLRQPKGPEGK